jgi:hypothetical protein
MNISLEFITGYGSSLGLLAGRIVTLQHCVFANQSSKACLWFWGLDSARYEISDLLFYEFQTTGQYGLIFSYSSVTIRSSRFVRVHGALADCRNGVEVTLLDCSLAGGSPATGACVIGVLRAAAATVLGSLEWPLSDFVPHEICKTIAATPMPTPTASPSATRSMSPRATLPRSPTGSRTPSRTPTLYTAPATPTSSIASSQWPDPTRSRSPRQTMTPALTMSPTATPPFLTIMGVSAGGAFLIAVMVFIAIFLWREASDASSEETIGRVHGYVDSDDGKRSDASDSQALNVHASSSSESG